MTGSTTFERSQAELDALSSARAEQVRRWRAGEQPPAEEFLARYPELAADVEAAMVLVYGEVLLREELNGTLPEPAEYRARFPSYAAALTAQFELHGALTEPAATPNLPGFSVVRELGRGGMGVVFLARDQSLDRLVAVKVLLSGAFASDAARQRFRTEAESVARLKHPHIVEVHAFGEHDGRPFLVMEYVAGGSLSQRLEGTPLEPHVSAKLLLSLAGAIAHAHAAGVVHRDLKPANILLKSPEDRGQRSEVRSQRSEDGDRSDGPLSADLCPLISDFGLAKRLDAGDGPTVTSQVLGTPSYMAPEQAAGAKDVGAAADVYALGAILYECLTGRPPFKAATPLETLAQLTQLEPAAPRSLNPAVPRDLETICLKCLSKDPAKRYATAGALADDLSRFLEGRPVLARPVGAAGRLWRFAKRKPAISSMAAALALLIPAALAGMTVLYLRADRDRRRAELSLDDARVNLRLAVDSIDRYFTRVSEDQRLKEQDLRPLRRQLLASAAEFHEQLLERRTDDPVIRAELARSLSRLGRLTAEIDTKPRAIEYYHQALIAFERLAEAEPGEPAHRREMADCHIGLGQLYADTAQPDRAEAAFFEARRLADRLVQDDPLQPEHRRRLAAVCRRHGAFFRQHARSREAEPPLKEAVSLCETLVREFPDDVANLNALAESYSSLGKLYQFNLIRRWREAVTAYQSALAIQLDVVRRAPAEPDYRSALGGLYRDLGKVLLLGKQWSESEDALVRGIAVHEALTREHSNVTNYLAVLASLYKELGEVYVATDRFDSAEKQWAESLRLRQRLLERDPSETLHAQMLADLQVRMGTHVLNVRNDAASALVLLDRAVAIVEVALARDTGLQGVRQTLKDAYGHRAETLTVLGRHAEALRDWDQVVELAEAPYRPYARAQRAVALARSGDDKRAVAEARRATDGLTAEIKGAQMTFSAVARAHALAADVVRRDTTRSEAERASSVEEYSAAAVEWLRSAIRAGMTETSPVLRSRDFEALRSRADFRSLFAQ